jgi:putative selenium metabolism protein SsnA
MLITNGKLVTWQKPNQILNDQAIHIKDGIIKEIGPSQDLAKRYVGEEILDAHGQYVIPGGICGHTHFYGAFARGMAIPGSPPKDFPEILQKLWWPLDKSLTAQDIKYSALVCMIDAIKHGTTTLIDHHASPNTIENSLDIITEAVKESGLRASLCYEVTDRDGSERSRKGIDENIRFINLVNKEKPLDGRIAASFGLHASLTLSEQTLDACRAAIPDGTGFHIHVAEHPVDEYDSLMKSGTRVVDRLHKHGILGPRTIVAHAVHVDAKEISLLAKTGTWVLHQPRSNMNNGVGIGNIESMMRAGVKVGLGNDGFSNAMWEEWKTAYLVHKVWNRDPRRMTGYDIVEMAVYNNAKMVSKLFDNKIVGKIEEDAQADLIFVDYHPFTPLTEGNLPWHMIFGFHESMVTTTIVDGRILMKDRQLLTLDENEIKARALELVPEVWERYLKNS